MSQTNLRIYHDHVCIYIYSSLIQGGPNHQRVFVSLRIFEALASKAECAYNEAAKRGDQEGHRSQWERDGEGNAQSQWGRIPCVWSLS